MIKPLDLYENLTKNGAQFRRNEQADTHEFLRRVICMLDEDITNHMSKNTNTDSINNPIKSLFGDNFQSEVKCLSCNRKSITFDPFMDISLDIPQTFESLENSLQRFTNLECLSDNYRCYNCKLISKANKVMSISKNPEILTIHLNRFDFSHSQTNKLSTIVTYP